MHYYTGALGGERPTDGMTYATSTASDEHNITLQSGFHA